jgi:hypothetical protein
MRLRVNSRLLRTSAGITLLTVTAGVLLWVLRSLTPSAGA